MQVLIPEQSLLQGMSTQHRTLRKAGQVEYLENMQLDVQRGLRRRNGTILRAKVEVSRTTQVQVLRIAGVLIVLLHDYVQGVIEVATQDLQKLHNIQDPYFRGAADDFRYTVYNETIIVLNRQQVVSKIPVLPVNPEVQLQWSWIGQTVPTHAVRCPVAILNSKAGDVNNTSSISFVQDWVQVHRSADSYNIIVQQCTYTAGFSTGNGTDSEHGVFHTAYSTYAVECSLKPREGEFDFFNPQGITDTAKAERILMEYVRSISIALRRGAVQNQPQATILDALDERHTQTIRRTVAQTYTDLTTQGIPINGGYTYGAQAKTLRITLTTGVSAFMPVLALRQAMESMDRKLAGKPDYIPTGYWHSASDHPNGFTAQAYTTQRQGSTWLVVPSVFTELASTYAAASGYGYSPTFAEKSDLPAWMPYVGYAQVGNVNPTYYEYSSKSDAWRETTPYPVELQGLPKQLLLKAPAEVLLKLQRQQALEATEIQKVTLEISKERSLMQDGDTNTNPDPEFLDSRINGAGVFQGRLVLLNADGVFFSATNKPMQFYRESVEDVQDSDPIAVYNPEAAGDWSWAIEFNQDLYVFSASTQGVIKGRTALTTKNAALLFNSNSPCDIQVQPVVQGTNLLYSAGTANLDIRQMLIGSVADVATTPTSITQHCSAMHGVKSMYANDGVGLLMCISAAAPKTLVVQQSVKDGATYLQNAWGYWTWRYFQPEVLSASATNILLYGIDERNPGELLCLSMPYPTVVQPAVDYQDNAFSSSVHLAMPAVSSGDNLLMQADAGARWMQAVLHVSSASEFQYRVRGRRDYSVSSQRQLYSGVAKSTYKVPLLVQAPNDAILEITADAQQELCILGMQATVRTQQNMRQL